ncbi:DMT family transporter [Noviherbaspirillum galbum]|uniref:EamA family transporter n=1 Tax=Noviherbaspirillum galbum TaxID=2709383 RepID=A0A6B3SV04_9BURK|nr:DMT family transporter [Noviherbaspirillum galbum]NEX62202.1 EamA family transporter [Noviherbaspirillum galbum]
MRQDEKKHRIGLAQIHVAVLLAGGAGLFAKLLTVTPEILVTGRTAFGSVALFLFAMATSASLRLRGARDLAMVVLSGVILAAHWLTFFLSIQVSTVAIGLLAFSTFPLFTTFLEPAIFGERLRRQDIVTAFVVMAGLVLVTPSFDVGNRLTQGLLWGIGSAFMYAVLCLLSRTYAGRYPAVTVSFYQQGVAALCTLPFALRWHGTLSAHDMAYLAVLGVVFTALGQGLVVASLRHLRVQTTSIVFGLEPVYGILLAWLLIGEIPSLRTLLGGGLICGAVLWASLGSGDWQAHGESRRAPQ